MTTGYIDLTGTITQEEFEDALDEYNSRYATDFELTKNGSSFSLTEGDDKTEEAYATGTLREVAFFWEGYIEGAIDGQNDSGEQF